VASELERRWNAKLEELDRVKKTFENIAGQRQALTREQEQRLRALGASFREVWESEACPIELKKKIVQTVIEEIVVDLDEASQTLHFVIQTRRARRCTSSFIGKVGAIPHSRWTNRVAAWAVRPMSPTSS